MRYREFAPPPDLGAVVQAAWVVDGEPGERVRVVPDACVDLIALDGGVDTVLLNGPMPVAAVVELAAPRTHGLRLVPGTLPRLAGLTSLSDLRGTDLVVRGPASGGPPLTQLTAWTRTLLVAGTLERHPDVDAALARSAAPDPSATTFRVGPRQLQRLFATYVGLSPQETAGVLRQSLVARALRSGQDRGLAVLAADHGYADQAHLTRAFTRLAGLPPGAYRRETAGDAFVQDAAAGRAAPSTHD